VSPAFWESKAVFLYPRRFWFVAGTIAGVLLFAGAGLIMPAALAKVAVSLSFTIITVSWCLFLAGFWFEPTKGAFSRNTWFRRHVSPLHTAMRWWSAIMLAMFLAVGVVAPIWWLVAER
jgi:hypothetical protein